MSNLSQFFGGGGGFYQQIPILSSMSWTAPVSGDYLITAIGGGGAGGSGGSAAKSAGAGGLAQSLVKLTAGDSLTIVCGAGGVGVTNASGGNGGTTTVTGPGVSLTANGGGGGTLTDGGAGGTASGGNIMNVTGGSALSVNDKGGGAVGVWGFTPPSSTTQSGAGVFSGRLSIPMTNSNYYTMDGYWVGSSLWPSLPESSSQFLGGRFLQPCGAPASTPSGSGDQPSSGPGASAVASSCAAGWFAGGTAISGSATFSFSARSGGVFGGGGGARPDFGESGGTGGAGGVIIEYFIK